MIKCENEYDLDAERELGVERTHCNDCQYNDRFCTCEEDCYFYNSERCPHYGS